MADPGLGDKIAGFGILQVFGTSCYTHLEREGGRETDKQTHAVPVLVALLESY